jgi:dihydrofolate reductase
MSRVVMWNLVTVDGCFEGPAKWDLGWHNMVLDDEFEQFAIEQLRQADRLLLGRRTYKGMAEYWPTAKGEIADLMNGVEKYVFTRSGEVRSWGNTTIVREDAAAAVLRLKRAGDGLSLVFGSAELCATLMEHDLFDEYRLLIVPLVLGCGSPLFEGVLSQHRLKLLEARALSSGGVIVRFEPVR